MQFKHQSSILLAILILAFVSDNCRRPGADKTRIVYVNSYHRGHPSSDEIMDAIINEFPADSFELQIFIMDTKRNSSPDYIEKKALQLYDSILLINPDIVLVSDDNAVKYLVQPHFSKSSPPVVFCGVNWSDKEYDLHDVNITGMLEILPLADVLLAMKSYYPKMKKLLVLNENTTTSRKEKLLLDSLYRRVGFSVEHELVDDFENWKRSFIKGNEMYDIIYISTNGGIKNWDKNEAVKVVKENIAVPVVTCEDFMMPYAVVGMTKVAREQGIWTAKTAKKILKGMNPTDIPVTRNQESVNWLNKSLADKINFQPDSGILKNARIVYE